MSNQDIMKAGVSFDFFDDIYQIQKNKKNVKNLLNSNSFDELFNKEEMAKNAIESQKNAYNIGSFLKESQESLIKLKKVVEKRRESLCTLNLFFNFFYRTKSRLEH